MAYSDARILFKAGKNHEGWFGSEQLLAQVDHTIDIFNRLTKGNAQGLFLFDNAPSHQKRAPDAPSAWKMCKSEFSLNLIYFNCICADPKDGWTPQLNGSCMRNGTLPTGESQPFYFPPNHLEICHQHLG